MGWKIILNMLSEPTRRKKLPNINTIEDVVHLIAASRKIIVLTGAGVSVSCGIPDFRSRDGVYARLAVDFPDLPDPQEEVTFEVAGLGELSVDAVCRQLNKLTAGENLEYKIPGKVEWEQVKPGFTTYQPQPNNSRALSK